MNGWVLRLRDSTGRVQYWCGLGNPHCRAAADVPSGAVYGSREAARVQARYIRDKLKLDDYTPKTGEKGGSGG